MNYSIYSILYLSIIIMSSWLNDTQLVQQLAEGLLTSKKTRYQEDIIRIY